jgi:hypothetical protein
VQQLFRQQQRAFAASEHKIMPAEQRMAVVANLSMILLLAIWRGLRVARPPGLGSSRLGWK